MNAKKHSPPPEPPLADEYPQVHVTRAWRVVIHVWLAIHLVALVAPPLAFATMGAPLPQWLYNLTRPYIDLCALDHGYAFFAPEVGPNHLVEYRVWQADAADPKAERFPNLQQQWPRLLYHRHFMLSETLNNRFEPSNLPPEFFPDRATYEEYQARRAMFERMRDSFANHLKHTEGAERVEIVRIEHRQPHPGEFQEGTGLSDESLYRELPDAVQPPAGRPQGPMQVPAPRFPFPYAPNALETGEGQ